jgi:hypothetical protein
MQAWSVTDWVLLGGAAYIAIVTLVRLMRRRRDELVADLTQQAEFEQARRRLLKKREKTRMKDEKRRAA